MRQRSKSQLRCLDTFQPFEYPPLSLGIFSLARSCLSRAFKKTLAKRLCKPLHSCGVFWYAEGIKKTLVLLKPSLAGTSSTVAAKPYDFLYPLRRFACRMHRAPSQAYFLPTTR